MKLDVMARRRSTINGVPLIVRKLTNYLLENENGRVEGIFRHSANDSLIESLKKLIDTGEIDVLAPGNFAFAN